MGATSEDIAEDGISKHWAPLNWIKDLVPKKKPEREKLPRHAHKIP